jgi:hypothetical protein
MLLLRLKGAAAGRREISQRIGAAAGQGHDMIAVKLLLALSEILRTQADILAAEGMPSNPDRFAALHRYNLAVEPSHPAYPIIAAVFGDIP